MLQRTAIHESATIDILLGNAPTFRFCHTFRNHHFRQRSTHIESASGDDLQLAGNGHRFYATLCKCKIPHFQKPVSKAHFHEVRAAHKCRFADTFYAVRNRNTADRNIPFKCPLANLAYIFGNNHLAFCAVVLLQYAVFNDKFAHRQSRRTVQHSHNPGIERFDLVRRHGKEFFLGYFKGLSNL